MITPMTNSALLIGQRGLRDAQQVIAQAAERLATGSRINRAADDPSGLIAVDQMTQIITVNKARLEALDQEEAMLGAKEGALSVVNSLLTELDGLVVQAANTGGMSEEEIEAVQMQADSIIEAMDMIANTAMFKGEKLFGSLFSQGLGRVMATFEDGDGNTGTQQATLADIRSGGLLNFVDGDLEAAQKSIESAIGSIGSQRSAIGARIRHEIATEREVLLHEIEQHSLARSHIQDADIAAEVSNLVRGQILQQASISALLFARQMPNAALQLLGSATGA